MTRREELRRSLDEMTPARRAELARRLARRRDARGTRPVIPALPRTGGAGRFPASPGQERLHFLHELAPDARSYVMPITVRLRGRLDEAALAEALGAVVRRHEALRTGFEADPARGMVVQVVRPADEAGARVVTGTAREDEIPRLMEELTRPRFDLVRGPLLRAALWRTEGGPGDEDGAWTLGLVLHHIVADGWSLGVLVKDLTTAYTALVTGDGTAPPLPEPPLQYADFAAWQRDWLAGEGPAPQREYWREALRGAPVLQVPGDRVPPAQRTFDGSSVPLTLPAPLTAALARVGREEQATLFMVLLAAYAYVLHRWSGEHDVVVGTPVAGRGVPETEDMFGFFVNTLALRVDLAGAGTFRDLVRRVRDVCVAGFAHQDVPFEQVVQELEGDRKGGRSSLVNALLTLTNVPLGPLRLPGVDVELPEQPRSGTDLDLSLEFTPLDGGALEGWLIYSADLYDRATAERIAEAVRCVLDTVAAAPADLPLHTLPVMSDATRDDLLHRTSGRAAAPYPGRPLADWFTDRVLEAPHRTALVTDAEGADPGACETLDYAGLDAAANRLAHWLRGAGLGVEDRVGICLERGTNLVTALLGVLKAGGVCVPLDPDHPEDRLAALVDDCRPRFVLTDSHAADRFRALAARDGSAGDIEVVALNLLGPALEEQPTARPDVPIAPMGAAYMLYTSGSTGRPKGVVLTHHGLGNRLRGMCDALAFTPDDTVLHKSTINSDPTLWELLVPLFSGGRVVLALPGRNTDPAYVHDVLARHRVTACDFVPSLLRPVLARPGFAEAAATLRVILSGGEELPPDMAATVLATVPGAGLYNCYGPTETSIDVAVQRVTPPVTAPVPVGAPVTGAELYVLDDLGRLQPPGVPGELLIGGVQVGRGYLGMPGRTAATHVPHPFRTGERLYRTGDLVRWRPDGTLDYLGRIDRQVKIRGYRVEPGEVENALRAHPAVAQAAVVARPRPEGGLELAAYLTLAPGTTGTPGPEVLRRHLLGRLPTPMLPSSFTVLDDFPRNANGKTDLLALPAPAGNAPRRAERVAPSGPLETVLAGIWSQTLGGGEPGVEDDFFALGGHSLMATLVVSQVRELFRVELPLHFFIEAPTIAALARMVRAQGVEAGVDTDRVASLVLQVQRMSAGEVTARLRN
ncbi:amino acid adenylation domain-containing protein [Streptomyces thermolilacinus]